MISLGPTEADLRIFTFKEGLLSPIAHDLQIRAPGFEILLDPDAPSVRARVEANRLEVLGAMKDGLLAASALSVANKAEIQQNLRSEVLHTQRFASILFESTAMSAAEVTGKLTLHGSTREIRFPWHAEGADRVAEIWLDQREYGIKPYTAMLGALKVQPRVKVVARLRWPAVSGTLAP